MRAIHKPARLIAITLVSLWGANVMAQTPPSTAATVPPPPGFDGLHPIMATHTVPPYPPAAVQLQEQGSVMMEVHITSEGAVDDCRIVQSSGAPSLDNASCDHVKAVWRWQPPTAQGKPVAVSTRISVKFDLKDVAPQRIIAATKTMPAFPAAEWKKKPSALDEQPTTLMRVRVTPPGTADNCNVLHSSGSALLDQAVCSHVMHTWRWTPAIAENLPDVGVAALIAVTWDVPNQQAVAIRPTVGELLIACASQERDVVALLCDPPLKLASIGVLVRHFGPDGSQMCGAPGSLAEKKDLDVYKEKILSWMRGHPEVRQDEPLKAASENAQAIFACQK